MASNPTDPFPGSNATTFRGLSGLLSRWCFRGRRDL